jgi:hypothetical protein
MPLPVNRVYPPAGWRKWPPPSLRGRLRPPAPPDGATGWLWRSRRGHILRPWRPNRRRRRSGRRHYGRGLGRLRLPGIGDVYGALCISEVLDLRQGWIAHQNHPCEAQGQAPFPVQCHIGSILWIIRLFGLRSKRLRNRPINCTVCNRKGKMTGLLGISIEIILYIRLDCQRTHGQDINLVVIQGNCISWFPLD